METKTKYCLFVGLSTPAGNKITAKEMINYISKRLPCFSVTKQTGYWNGQKEKSLCITYIGTGSDVLALERVAKDIQKWAFQESVYLTQEQITLFDINSEYVPRETYNSRV